MPLAKKFVLCKPVDGLPKSTDFELVEEELPPLGAGEVLVEAEYLSVDPYMGPFCVHLPVGATMIGIQVAKIIESKNLRWPVDQRVVAFLGWRTHSVIDPDYAEGFGIIKHTTYKLPDDMDDLPPSLALGVLGLPGNAAYFGFVDICKPKAGETVVVSSAAGAIGSHVGQIAKIFNCQVIGITDTDDKCSWIVNELGFDHAINYKSENLANALKKTAPDGIDCYFDNVGGEISSTVINQMNDFGRVSVCGSISCYKNGNIWNHNCLPKATLVQPNLISRQIKMEGFFVTRWESRWNQGIERNLAWIKEGKLKYRETVTEGFENTFNAFLGLFSGENIGKAVVKVSSSNSSYDGLSIEASIDNLQKKLNNSFAEFEKKLGEILKK